MLEFSVEPVAAFIKANLFWAGPVLGLITFGESLVLVGAFFPATALMLVTGSLIATGVLEPAPVLAWCVAGAVLGDAVSYSIGRRAGGKALRHPWLRRHRRVVARARLFFRKYGVASIFICRFTGPIRAFVPLIAGATRMKPLRFQAANLMSAAVWVPAMLAPGYFATRGLTLGESADLGWIALAAGLAGLAAYAAWRGKRTRPLRPVRRARRPRLVAVAAER